MCTRIYRFFELFTFLSSVLNCSFSHLWPTYINLFNQDTFFHSLCVSVNHRNFFRRTYFYAVIQSVTWFIRISIESNNNNKKNIIYQNLLVSNVHFAFLVSFHVSSLWMHSTIWYVDHSFAVDIVHKILPIKKIKTKQSINKFNSMQTSDWPEKGVLDNWYYHQNN